jgi:hypothetical protein
MARYLELDSTKELRCNALLQSARYLLGIRCYHDRNVQERSFSIGDYVLHRIQDEIELYKLNSRLEGPFIVTKVTNQSRIDYNTLTARRSQTPGISSSYGVFTLR